MFFRTKKSGPRTYLQIVENHRSRGKIQQRVIATLGRLEELQSSGQLDALLCSGARFAEAVMLSAPTRADSSRGEVCLVADRGMISSLTLEPIGRAFAAPCYCHHSDARCGSPALLAGWDDAHRSASHHRVEAQAL